MQTPPRENTDTAKGTLTDTAKGKRTDTAKLKRTDAAKGNAQTQPR